MNCPACGQHIRASDTPATILSGIPLSKRRRAIADLLMSRWPRDVSMAELIHELYWSDIDGGPDNPGRVVSIHIYQLRRIFAEYGWTISHAARSRYRLEKLQ